MKKETKMKRINKGLWNLMLMGLRSTGGYTDSLMYIYEYLTPVEATTLEEFYTWIEAGIYRNIGRGNYNERYTEYLNSK